MPRFVGATHQVTTFNGQTYDNIILSVRLVPGEDDIAQADIICGEAMRHYKMKTVLFNQCLKACFCDRPDDLMGKQLILSINKQYNTCQLFTVVPE